MFWRTVLLLAFSYLLPIQAVLAEELVQAQRIFEGVGLDRPVWVGALPGNGGQFVVAEQRGRVLLIGGDDEKDQPHKRVLLDLTRDLPNYADRGRDQLGLLGLAFHPGFEKNRSIYLHYTASGPRRNIVSRWLMGKDGAIDPASEEVLIEQRQPYATNNGGAIGFGPDGYLYIGIGDGGAHADPRNHAQNRGVLLGKVLRIDVDGVDEERGLPYAIPDDNPFVAIADARPEVYAYGLSNPWRFSFDQETGKLWLGDVGENDWEEINQIKRGGNYGWPWYEGTHPLKKPGRGEALPTGMLKPEIEYPHSEGRAVVGGCVYRGKAIPELTGWYVYADYVSGKVWALKPDEQSRVLSSTHLLTIPHPSSFGEGANGELLICSFGEDPNNSEDDGIYQLAPARKE